MSEPARVAANLVERAACAVPEWVESTAGKESASASANLACRAELVALGEAGVAEGAGQMFLAEPFLH
eukprot:13738146-Alexandrium_andersonii.AAC.1